MIHFTSSWCDKWHLKSNSLDLTCKTLWTNEEKYQKYSLSGVFLLSARQRSEGKAWREASVHVVVTVYISRSAAFIALSRSSRSIQLSTWPQSELWGRRSTFTELFDAYTFSHCHGSSSHHNHSFPKMSITQLSVWETKQTLSIFADPRWWMHTII